MSTETPPIRDLLDDYVHDNLTPAGRQMVEEALAESPELAKELDAARERFAALNLLSTVEAPESLIRDTMLRIESIDRARRGRRWRFAKVVGFCTVAAAVVIGAINIYYVTLKPTPFDLRVYGQEELLADSNASLRIGLYDLESEKPVGAIPIVMTLINPNTGEEERLADATTDVDGTARPRFELPDWAPGNYQLRIAAKTEQGEEVITRNITLSRPVKVMVSSDKPIYQPGQTVRVRSLALRRPSLKPVEQQSAVYTITDPRGNMIFRQETETSRFGISDTRCPLAKEILEGDYTINCTVGDTESSITVKVQQYVLPKFQIAVSLDQPYYQPADTIRGELQASYFTKKPVAGGDVEIVLQTVDVGAQRLETIQAQTDDNGSASFEFKLPEVLVGRPQNVGDAEVQIVAVVTDTAGQKHAVAQSRTVTEQAVRITVVPESGRMVHGFANRIYVLTTTPDGRPVSAKVAVTGDLFDSNQSQGEEFDLEVDTNSLGVGSFEATPTRRQHSLNLTATDTDGKTGTANVTLHRDDASLNSFLLRTDRAVYQSGDTMEVSVLGGGKQPVFLDFLKDGQTILTRTVEITDGEGQLSFDIPPDLFGTVRLCAWRFDADPSRASGGLPVMNVRTIYIDRPSGLNIAASLDRDDYRPGEKAVMKFQLTDDDGEPVPGAISLSAVDEAVFHVLSQRPGMEETFFQLEQELLQPVYAVYSNWSPQIAGEPLAEEQVEFENAVFARTAQAVDEIYLTGSYRYADYEFSVKIDGGPEGFDWSGESADSPITLSISSFPPKQNAAAQKRREGIRRAIIAWWSLAGVFIVTCAFGFAFFNPKAFLITVGISTAVLALAAPVVLCMGWVGLESYYGANDSAMASGMDTESMPLMDWDGDAGAATEGDQPIRVRRHFPETLIWRPQIITDENGQATLEIPLADSITTWRVSSSAVSAEGELGSLQSDLTVFQPFFVDLNLPVALTRGDEISVPVVVYNYLDQPQTVEVTLTESEWFEFLEADFTKTVSLDAGAVKSVYFRIKAKHVGEQSLEVFARSQSGNRLADAILREITVDPDGRRVEQVQNGSLAETVTATLTVPDEAIDGSVRTIVKLYPSGFSQLVEGLDGIFERPYGCFEQTSSTTYPNVLALRYLKETGTSAPKVEAKARQYIHLGYQRLLGFEVSGGGFDWYGNPPASRTLTAYGLMEFVDMAEVHDVDPALIERTRAWLIRQQRPDGSWEPDRGVANRGLEDAAQGIEYELTTTAYIAWAVAASDEYSMQTWSARDYLLTHPPDRIQNPYTLALVANALIAIEEKVDSAKPYLDRLETLKQSSESGKQIWWNLGEGSQTTFYGGGISGDVEVTALAALAMIEGKVHSATARKALTWLVEQRDARGTWHSTQATVLALKALIAGSAGALGDQPRVIDISVDGQVVETVEIPADQAEVMQQLELTRHFGRGEHSLTLTEHSDTATSFQVAFRYHVPETMSASPEPEPLRIAIEYDRTQLAVNELVTAKATVTNTTPSDAPMVILDLPIPAGFRVDPVEFEELAASAKIGKYEVTARAVIVYLRDLPARRTLVLDYNLIATTPVKVAVRPAVAYEYYNPEKRGAGESTQVEVTAE